MKAKATEFSFTLAADYYACQHAGAIEWITRESPSRALMLTDPSRLKDSGSRRDIGKLRRRLVVVSSMRTLLHRAGNFSRRKRSLKSRAAALVGLTLYPAALLVDRHITRKADAEWDSRQKDPRGSEMYLHFTRGIDG